jgi:hypothetical protein
MFLAHGKMLLCREPLSAKPFFAVSHRAHDKDPFCCEPSKKLTGEVIGESEIQEN